MKHNNTITLDNNSLLQRKLVRKRMPRPSIRFVNKKKEADKKKCREKN